MSRQEKIDQVRDLALSLELKDFVLFFANAQESTLDIRINSYSEPTLTLIANVRGFVTGDLEIISMDQKFADVKQL